ncbi:hypothetical protein KCTC52924_01638 [Arenibacter antarcticus]
MIHENGTPYVNSKIKTIKKPLPKDGKGFLKF